jgi:hypothetical protein
LKNTLNDAIQQKLVTEARLIIMDRSLKEADKKIKVLESQVTKSSKQTTKGNQT